MPRLATLVLALLAIVACGTSSAAAVVRSPGPSASASESASPSPTAEAWNLDADIGSIMVLSWTASTPWPQVQSVLVNDHIGGALLFAANFGGTPQGLKRMNDQLLALSARECLSHPLLTMLDQEGGDVTNVKAPFAPPWQVVMASGGAAHVHDLEKASAAGLRAAGLGLNLAPVADVRTNPLDAVIGGRSFGSKTNSVAPLVAAAVQGLHDGGVGATLKHFPGLGGAAGDPHLAIPTDSESAAHWMSVQVPAFRAGVAAGADAVMVTAVYEPALGARTVPAIFSPQVVGLIRTQLGFDGVVMTDSLSMGGIGAKWSLPQAAILSLAAGNDMILLSNGSPSYEASAILAVKKAVISGRLSWVQIHASAQRVNALRDRWGRAPAACTSAAA
ncbi:MAG TPA: glycoside hydrolase family 3 N-terminal domain-containing protein [Candidatus Dormibacteraeota bacterium]|nr:glycoside hydrolase family 3 N-terminal domain-containing protein [Candidatus Dormibacteraeota bacterium]